MHPSLLHEATAFLERFHQEQEQEGLEQRLTEVRDEIADTGTYTHTFPELEFGARVAWRNSNRCIGRLYWKSLKVRDYRHLETEDAIFRALTDHVQDATNDGRIRSIISIFRPAHPIHGPALRFWNDQLFRYAGYPQEQGPITGDPLQADFTRVCQSMGWKGAGTAFDLLPLIMHWTDRQPALFHWPREAVLEVPILHPEQDWLTDLGLRWHALPVISGMALSIGGIDYTAAPFNGWYMLTEIAVRNLADEHRYNLLPLLADRMGLDRSRHHTLWKDRALLELQTAVLHSFRSRGVTLVDHHTAAEQFIEFEASEQRRGRSVQADWAWINPPTAASTTPVFHRDWDNTVHRPNFYYQLPAWQIPSGEARKKAASCPFHLPPRDTPVPG